MLTTDPAFTPPHCPNAACPHHRHADGWRWERNGTFARQTPPRSVRRFRCLTCGKCFSSQTFDVTYYLKRPDLLRPLHAALVGCSGLRQFARAQRIAPSTAQRQASRLGRHCLLHQWSLPLPDPAEDLVLDGFVTFEYSQHHPFEINLLVGAESHYVYGFTWAQLRRSGRMTSRQRRRREELERRHGRPPPRATETSVAALIRLAVPHVRRLRLRSDEHASYPRAFRGLPHPIDHATVSSRRCRSRANPLFAVDLLDLLIRHSRADHKRETIAFAKRGQGALERLAVFLAWRNFMKKTSERRKDSPTPAQSIGARSSRLEVDELLARRLFPSRVPLPPELHDVYWRRVPTRMIPNGTTHRLKNAA